MKFCADLLAAQVRNWAETTEKYLGTEPHLDLTVISGQHISEQIQTSAAETEK